MRLSIEEFVDRFHGDSESFQNSLESDLPELLDTGSLTVEVDDGSGVIKQAVISLNFELLE